MPDYLDNKLRTVSDMIIAKLEKLEHAGWQKPWINIGGGLARNLSGRYYGGSNLFFLSFHAEEKGYTAPIYLTFLQAKEAGLQIKKGEHSFPIFYHNITITDKLKNKIDAVDFKLLSKDEQKECEVKSFLRAYDVFNIDQTNMPQVDPVRYAALMNKDDEMPQRKYHNTALSSMIDNNAWVCPIEFRGNEAYYSVSKDIIVFPQMEQFRSQEEFFGTLLHEMSHSTGHEQRLNRDLVMVNDTVFRAREELIAEISSAMAGMKLGIQREISENNYAYIKSWIDTARQDNKFVYKAIVDAAKASDYITEALGIKNELDEKIELAMQVKATEDNVVLSQTVFENEEDINERFNKELQRQIDGTLPKGHTYELGNAGSILQSADIPNLPIELQASRLSDKTMQENHPFNLSEIRELPKAIQNPMSVFRSATHIGSYVIMTEIEHMGENFVVALEANRKQGKIEVNSIRSVYPKNNRQVANWIDEGLLNYVDKKRTSEWLSKQRSNSADVRQLFGRAAKIIQNFENPKLSDTNLYYNMEYKMGNLEKFVLVKDKNTPVEILSELAKDENRSIREGVAMHSNTSAETLAELAKDENRSIREGVAMHSNTSAETLAELAKDENEIVREFVAEHSNTSVETLAELAKDKDWGVRVGVAGHPNASVETLTELAKDKDEDVRMVIGDNLNKRVIIALEKDKEQLNRNNIELKDLIGSNASAEELAELAKSEDVRIRRSVAMHSNTSAETLAELAKDEFMVVRRTIAEHSGTSVETLAELSKDEDWRVRAGVAKHSRTPAETLAELAKDKDWGVRAGVAGHPNTSVETLTELAKDKDEDVRMAVAENPNTSVETLAELAKDEYYLVRANVAGNHNILIENEEFMQLAKDVDYVVREFVALHPNTSVETLTELAKDENEIVREFVAKNPKTPTAILTELAKDKDEAVRMAVAENLNQREIIALEKDKTQLNKNNMELKLSDLMNAVYLIDSNATAKELAKLAKSEDIHIRGGVAGHPNTPAEILAELAGDKNELVREMVTYSSKTPAEVLAKLSKDENKEIRANVASHPNTPAEILTELAEDKNGLVREMVTYSSKTPAEVLAKLSKDENWRVCENVAKNDNTPAEILAELAKDENWQIRENVAKNDNTPAEILAELAKDKNLDVRISALDYAQKRGFELRFEQDLPKKNIEAAQHSENHSITADEFLIITAEQRASLPENLTIVGDLYLDAHTKGIPADIATLRLPDNLTVDGNLSIDDHSLKDRFTLGYSNFNSNNNQKIITTVMSEKNYVGNSYKTVTEKGAFYNFEIKKEAVEKMDGIGKRNEIMIAIEPKKEVREKYPTHSVYVGDKHSKRELQLVVSKDELLKAPVDDYGNIKAFAASREKIGADLSNYSVALDQKDPETGKHQFVGRAYDEAVKFGETRVMGTVIKTPLDEYGTNSAKVYNMSIDVDKVGKLTVNEYGDARLGIVPYNEKVLNPDGSTTEQTRYLVTETTSATKGIEATIAIHITNPNGKEYPTIDSCAVHKIGDSEIYKLAVQDRKSENIGKDCADLTVSENKYTPEMKDLPEAERKAALGEKNYVGRGWTNDPDKIRLDHKSELKPEGLTKAIDNNHTVKVMAILNKSPNVVRESHIKQLEARNKEGLKTSPVIEDRVKQALNETVEHSQKKTGGLKV